MNARKKVWIWFESSEDRDQTLIYLSTIAIIALIAYRYHEQLKSSIDNVLSMFLGSYITIVTFYFKSKNGNHQNHPQHAEPVETENIDDIIRRAKRAKR